MTDNPPPPPALLLVDDRPENLLALEAVLEPLGQRMVRANSGKEALRHLLADDIAVIVLDVQMPGIDGFETAERIKQRDRTRDIPIIFLTAISHGLDNRLRGYGTGAVDYIFKPVEPEVLRAKVAVFLELYLKTRTLQEQRRQLALQKAELERSNQDLEQFAYIASHDLQDPLRVISGFIELLGDRFDDKDSQAGEWMARITSTAARMSELICDLLAYARAGVGPAPLEPVELDAALHLALQNLSRAAQVRPVDLRSEPLGQAMGNLGDMTQVFQNLVGNAVKFHEADVVPVVEVGAQRQDGMVTVSVTDEGPGVPQDQLERVFQVFERVEGEPYPGTGLGLAVCRKVVERAGGRIWMENNEGSGVTVRFSLPAVRE
ncbi:MAG TPA: ATP-binding protein [Acidimicrobiales bacterium]|nr:ATP-binding protein [Acidimicrobiales bacterium]